MYVAANKSPDVTLEVDVPDGQASGKTRLAVRATSGTLQDTLPLDVSVAEQAAGDVTLTTDFAELQGSSDQTFDFNLDLKNDTAADIVFGLTTRSPVGLDRQGRADERGAGDDRDRQCGCVVDHQGDRGSAG